MLGVSHVVRAVLSNPRARQIAFQRSLSKDTTAWSSAGPTTKSHAGVALPKLWAEIDAGKANHHCVVINAGGEHSSRAEYPTTKEN